MKPTSIFLIVLALAAVLSMIVFWVQSNSLLNRLKATNPIHTGISIFQVFFVLFYLYALGLGIGVGSAADTRVLESSAAVLIGVTAYLGWWYASGKAGLLAENVSDEEARDVAQSNFAEPMTALLTIPAAFIKPSTPCRAVISKNSSMSSPSGGGTIPIASWMSSNAGGGMISSVFITLALSAVGGRKAMSFKSDSTSKGLSILIVSSYVGLVP